jgi:hypothetical protein
MHTMFKYIFFCSDIIYFEVTVLSTIEEHVTLGVGFDVPGVFYGGQGTGMVGWFRDSIGYHGIFLLIFILKI